MKTLLMLILMTFSVHFAQANDSSIAFLKVQGVNPHGNPENSKVDVYGGKDMIYFFNALPSLAPWFDADYRSVQMISGAWVGSIDCTRTYVRPTTGKDRDDYKCSFAVSKKTPYNDPESSQYLGDSYLVTEFNDGFTNFWGNTRDLDVLGIFPDQVQQQGKVYSFYGQSTKILADVIIQRGPLVFNSKTYSVALNCSQYYVHPISGQLKDDYECSLSYAKR